MSSEEPGAARTAPLIDDESARKQAIEQIERRRRFWRNAAVSTVVLLVVMAVWAVTEYNNAGGWPTDGFSQSSSIPHVWNVWIVYPVLGWLLYLTVTATATFVNRPIREDDIRREMDRQAGVRRR